MPAPQESEDAGRLDDLRRRLYRADATESDVQHYSAVRAATLGREPPADAPEDPATPSRSRRRALIAVAVVVVAGAALTLGVRLAQPTAETARPAPTAVPGRGVGDAQLFAIDADGVTRPRSIATTIGGTAVVGQRFEGHGPAVVPIDLTPGSFDGGRALVVLTAAQPVPIAWQALKIVTRNDWSSYPVVMASSTAAPSTNVAIPITFLYGGAPPARIAVQAQDDVRWTLVVAVAPRKSSQLR